MVKINKLFIENSFAFVLLALFIIVPLAVGENADIHNIIIYILIYALVGEGWNLISGFTGQTSFGHAAYFGIGAYTVAVMGNKYDVVPWVGMLAGMLIAAALAFLINYQLFRLKGHYFAIATLAVSEILRTIFSVWPYVGGGDGIKILFRPENKALWLAIDVRNRLPFLYITLALFVAVFVLCKMLENSKMGYYWKAIRESHEVAEAIGINPQNYKVYAMMLSAAIAAVGGGLYVQFFKYIDSYVFSLDVSMIFVLVTVLGGIGNVYGPIIGSIIYYVLDLAMRRLLGGTASGLNLIIFGILIIVVVVYQPKGIMGIFDDIVNRRRLRKLKASQATTNASSNQTGGDSK
ncbi:MAG TPA: branched-chain amino acid ABC transporter permease [Clostridiaceae bacterium]|nr:branched-chain amino acid ABC transporter permease [Clostridiaceae bacterium]